MNRFKGFAELRKPSDLVKKLEFDLERIRQSPQDQYAAFDFFVTAEHIVDWIYPDNGTERTKLREKEPLLQVISHLASGAKHFEAKRKCHKSVLDVEKSRYVEEEYFEEKYTEDPLIVHLTLEAQKHFGQSSIEVVTLAEEVYEYWKKKFKEDTI